MVTRIDQSIFMMTFAADANYRADLEGQETYLDKETGELEYAITDRFQVEMNMGSDASDGMLDSYFCNSHPETYLEISSMSHGQHHSVMQNFLMSSWVADQARVDLVSNVYYPRKSISYWLKNVGDQSAIDAYFVFREEENVRLAEEFLRDNGVSDFEWT